MFPLLAGGFLSTVPSVQYCLFFFLIVISQAFSHYMKIHLLTTFNGCIRMGLIVLINHSLHNCTVWSFPVLAVVSSPIAVIIPKAFPVQFSRSVVSNSL